MRFIKGSLFTGAVFFGLISSGLAPTTSPAHAQTPVPQTVAASSYQAQAQAEAQKMAARRYKGHIQGTVAGVRFCGVGWSSSSRNAPTCRPSRPMTLVADAVVRGSDGWYRVRYWR